MKTVSKLLFGVTTTLLCIELILIPITLYINECQPDLINEKQFLCYDIVSILITFVVSSIIFELTKPKNFNNRKYEN